MKTFARSTALMVLSVGVAAMCLALTPSPRISIDYSAIESTDIGRSIQPYLFIDDAHIKKSVIDLIDKKFQNRAIDARGVENLGAVCDDAGVKCTYASQLTYRFDNLPPENRDRSHQSMKIVVVLDISSHPPNVAVNKTISDLPATQ